MQEIPRAAVIEMFGAGKVRWNLVPGFRIEDYGGPNLYVTKERVKPPSRMRLLHPIGETYIRPDTIARHRMASVWNRTQKSDWKPRSKRKRPNSRQKRRERYWAELNEEPK